MFTMLLGLLAASAVQASTPQDGKKPTAKYAELVGSYAVDMRGQPMVFTISEDAGKLFIVPEGDRAGECEPVENKALTFVCHAPNGRTYTIVFVRGEDNSIVKFTATGGVAPFEGVKQKRSDRDRQETENRPRRPM
jgi:hypothetical protein